MKTTRIYHGGPMISAGGFGGGGGTVSKDLIEVAVAFANPLVIDSAAGDVFEVTLTASTVIGAPLNPAAGRRIVFRLIQGGTGSYTITSWNAVFKFCDSLPTPVLSTTVGKRDYLQFQYNGTSSTWDFIGEAYGHA